MRFTKEKLIESLKVVKQSVCCYNQKYQGFCDCKFITNQAPEQIKSFNTENTGCCEISMAIYILENMSYLDYLKFTRKNNEL